MIIISTRLGLSLEWTLDSCAKFHSKLIEEHNATFNELEFHLLSLEKEIPEIKETFDLLLRSSYLISQFKLDSAVYFIRNSKNTNDDFLFNKVKYFQLGVIYQKLRYFEKSNEYFEKSHKLRLKEAAKYLDRIITDESTLNKIAKNYLKLNQYNKAKGILQKQITRLDFLNKPKKLATKIATLANIYFKTKSLDTLEHIYRKYSRSKFIDDSEFRAYFFTSYAYYQYLKKNLEQAIILQKNAYKARLEMGKSNLILNSLVSLAKYYNEFGALDSARYYFKKSELELIKQNRAKATIHFYRNILNYYKMTGDSLKYIQTKQILSMIDENTELTNKIFENSEKIFLKESELIKTEMNLKLLVAFSVLLILLSIIIIRLLIIRKKNEHKLFEKTKTLNNEIESHIETHKNLEHQLSQKNKLIGLISHDLINPLGASVALIDMAKEMVEKPNEELIDILNACRKSISDNRKMLQDIMKWIIKTENRYDYKPEIIELYDLVNSVYEMLKIQIKTKNLDFKNNVDQSSRAWVDPEHIQVVMRNIIQNAIKFTDQYGKIVVDFYTEDDFIFISIEDNGIGMTEEETEQIFDTKRLIYQSKSKNKKGHGFGMIISREFVSLNRGEIFVSSELNKGTKFTIKLPRKENV